MSCFISFWNFEGKFCNSIKYFFIILYFRVIDEFGYMIKIYGQINVLIVFNVMLKLY